MERKTCSTLTLIFLSSLQVGFLSCDAAEVLASMNPAVVGSTVTLSLSPSVTLTSGNWAVGEKFILTWLGQQQAVFPGYSSRASVNVTSGDLTLSSLTVSDTGVYTVQSGDPLLKASVPLTVVEPISNVTLNINGSDLIERQTSGLINCSVSTGSSLSFLWMNGSSEITASDRVQLSDGNSTLNIVSVSRYDSGPFRCDVSNPISNGSSDSVNFTVSYGPDNMRVIVNELNNTSFSVGSNLSLLCLTESSPPAYLQWAFKGNIVNVTGTMLELSHVREDQSGPYSCLAFNNRTNLRSNVTTYITISKSEQLEVNIFILSLLILTGFSLSIADQ
ncbi:PREDICTED: carcinoembryonic antigen-related cell adhesion molecule 5-like isoform X1 [Cyprinodon variegatus]|uniref:Carcinoembryonic antigen-related cell adhesion molecule 1-like n=1 Tax=Cyprinodon variegatus TaxID=28743 RepID=A0A3Q2CLU0_CYPVA|nr:PREDICTED: carcinoembryonic antigen-related cell adhesion molecule 5-like isoform X1 [Cyprinodon variegatus]